MKRQPLEPMQTVKPCRPPPRLSELGTDLLTITKVQRWWTVAVPFICVGLFLAAACAGHWIIAVGALVYLSFVTYGSTSHDLVHRNLGLSPRLNEIFLTLIELLAIRSGHAYRLCHLHHHARYPADDDVEASASKKTLVGALLEGVTYHFNLWLWAFKRTKGREHRLIMIEGMQAATMILASILFCKWTFVPLVYVALMIMGAWVTPLITSYVPHNPHGKNELEQTRVFRGKIFSIVAFEHLYHLEHHLYPSVPHQNWPKLAKRLDPYFEQQGVTPVRSWF